MKRFASLSGLPSRLVAVVAAMLASAASFGFVVALYASASGELDVAMGHVSAAVAAVGGAAPLAAPAKPKPG